MKGVGMVETYDRMERQDIHNAVNELNFDVIDGQYRTDEYKYLLIEALSAVPRELTSKVLRECQFRVFSDYDRGFTVLAKETAGKDVIFINQKDIRENPEKTIGTILHELAHLWLGHTSKDDLSKREKAAEEQEKKWFEIWKEIREPNWKDGIRNISWSDKID
jgi:hypothetical protein